MRKLLFVLAFSFLSVTAFSWGATGHRVTGYVADRYLTSKARKAIQAILGQQSMAIASNWMDEIRSDSTYKMSTDVHWVTINDGMTYDQSEKNPKGDVIMTIERLIIELKSKKFTGKEQAERLKMLIHLIGDIHQPLHVGRPDKGGNSVKVTWFGEETNLHTVWDSNMIDGTKLSYTELAESLDKPDATRLKQLQTTDVRVWAAESMTYRNQVYNIGNAKLSYTYAYYNLPLVRERLMQAGVRLATVLNEIYK